MTDLFTNTLELGLTAAPWLLLGLLAAGLIKAWLPTKAIGGRLGSDDWRSVTGAALIGAPLPLCSCGVLPAAFALRRAGASKGATTSFLVATPETGVDSIALSYALLGPFLAIVRPIAAILSAIAAGLLVGRVTREPTPKVHPITTAALVAHGQGNADSCCNHPHHHHHNHDAHRQESYKKASAWRRSLTGLRYAFTDLIDDLAVWLLIGLLIAGIVVTLIPPATLAAWGSGLVAMLLILVVSVPMYVCATATTPLAHAMLHTGVSPGTVLVFMLAGPATNIASLVLIRRELGGNKPLAAYLTGVCGGAVFLGLVVDALWGWLGFSILAGHIHDHDHSHILPLWITAPSLIFLMMVAVRPVRRALLGQRKRLPLAIGHDKS